MLEEKYCFCCHIEKILFNGGFYENANIFNNKLNAQFYIHFCLEYVNTYQDSNK